jgi:hypothetical protein
LCGTPFTGQDKNNEQGKRDRREPAHGCPPPRQTPGDRPAARSIVGKAGCYHNR